MTDYIPQLPDTDREVPVWTYQDAVEHLLDRRDVDRADGRNLRQARRAVETIYREFTQSYRWKYFDRYATIRTVAQQTTGSIAFDLTGGAYECELTLTGATWPSDARFYRVIIADAHYDIEDRKSSTVVTLKQHNNPGADVAAATSYTLYRRAYPLPQQFRTLYNVHEIAGRWQLKIVDSDAQQWASIGLSNPSTPFRCTVRNEGETFGHLQLVFDPPPNTAELFEVFYRSAPRPLTTEREIAGTVTTAGTTSIVGSSTAFASKHVGAVIRFSSSTTVVPTGFAGSPPTDDLGGDGTYQPYTAQRIIQSVTNATTLTVDAAVSTLTGVKYAISDPLDLRGDSMLTAFLRGIEAEYAELTASSDAEHERASLLAQKYGDARIRAIENDYVLDQSPVMAGYDPFSYTTSTDEE